MPTPKLVNARQGTSSSRHTAWEERAEQQRIQKDSILDALQRQYELQAESQAMKYPVYDPTIGLNIGFDFASYLPEEATALQIVYSIFGNGSIILEPQQIGPIATNIDQDNTLVCLMQSNKNIQHIPAISELQLIMELQAIDQNGSVFNIGWTFINLFDPLNRLKYGFE